MFFGLGMNIALNFRGLHENIKRHDVKIKTLSAKHQNLLELAKKFNNLYLEILFIQFFVMVFTIVFAGVQLNFVSTLDLLAKKVSHSDFQFSRSNFGLNSEIWI